MEELDELYSVVLCGIFGLSVVENESSTPPDYPAREAEVDVTFGEPEKTKTLTMWSEP